MTTPRSYRRRSRVQSSTANLLVVLLCVFSIFPIYWMIKSSFEVTQDLLNPTLLPAHPTLDNYRDLFQNTDFGQYFVNSALAATGTVVLTVVAATLAGYGLTRFPVPGIKVVARSVLFSYMFPALAIAIPLFVLFRGVQLTNSVPGLVLAHTSMALPFGIWLMWQAFQAVPSSFHESAYSLGSGRLRTFVEVELPLAVPGVVTVAIFAFAASWEDYTFSFILQTNSSQWTLPVAVNSFVHGDYVSWGLVTSVGLFMALPPMLIVLFLQRFLVTGLGSGGLRDDAPGATREDEVRMAGVRLEGIRKVYDKSGSAAVKGLDLEVHDGEFVTLVGPSGCGKTTTLRMIAGLETVTEGRILFDGDDVTDVPVQDRGISMVFQNYAIFPHMSVEANIGYGLRVARVPSEERARKVREVAELTGISELLGRYPRQLSGGQRQRVALARALARDPKTILLDEPLSNLDAKLRDRTRAELKRLHRELSSTMIYVTHDQLEAITMSDRIAVMNEGELLQYGTPREVFHEPTNLFVASFIGSPAINLFSGRLEEHDGRTSVRLESGLTFAVDSELARAAQGRAVTIGVRPQHVQLGGPDGERWQIALIESLGTEAIVHLRRGADVATAVCPEPLTVREGDEVPVAFPLDTLLVFDQETGNAVVR